MSRRNKKRRGAAPGQAKNFTPGRGNVITFGKPQPILTTGTDYYNLRYDNQHDYWKLPIDRLALAQLPNLNAQHGGVMYARRNMIAGDYLGGGLTHDELQGAVFDYLLCGDVALVKERNIFGRVVGLFPLASVYCRRRKNGELVFLQEEEPIAYSPDDIVFIKSYDPRQQVYGLPDYIGGIHSLLLNSEATIFRRNYYNNGAHMGFILYTNDPNLSDEVEEEIKKKIEESKGVGNFSNLYINIPRGNPEGVKLLPIGEVAAKDEFNNVKSISAQDVLTVHRFPAGLAGIIPDRNSSLPDPEKARDTYRKDEVIPMQRKLMRAVNDDPEIPSELHLRFSIPDNE